MMIWFFRNISHFLYSESQLQMRKEKSVLSRYYSICYGIGPIFISVPTWNRTWDHWLAHSPLQELSLYTVHTGFWDQRRSADGFPPVEHYTLINRFSCCSTGRQKYQRASADTAQHSGTRIKRNQKFACEWKQIVFPGQRAFYHGENMRRCAPCWDPFRPNWVFVVFDRHVP